MNKNIKDMFRARLKELLQKSIEANNGTTELECAARIDELHHICVNLLRYDDIKFFPCAQSYIGYKIDTTAEKDTTLNYIGEKNA